jgi:two-component system response regulator (stage 0 sporulation protein F)
MKIMVVDDEKDVEILFRQQFRKEIKEGVVELCYAFSGQDALTYLDSQDPPDVMYILSDINMPEMTGLELLRIIREKYPQIKVSMITAYGDEHNYRVAMSNGAEFYFTKPIDFSRIKKDLLHT